MITAKLTQTRKETSNLPIDENKKRIINRNASSTLLLPKTKYPFPYQVGIFGIAAKKYMIVKTSNTNIANKLQYVLGI